MVAESPGEKPAIQTSNERENWYAREHNVKVEMEIHKIFDSVLALVVRISERVVEQIVDVFVRQSMDESVDVVKRIWQERTQGRTAEEMVEVPVPQIEGRMVEEVTRERVQKGLVEQSSVP